MLASHPGCVDRGRYLEEVQVYIAICMEEPLPPVQDTSKLLVESGKGSLDTRCSNVEAVIYHLCTQHQTLKTA